MASSKGLAGERTLVPCRQTYHLTQTEKQGKMHHIHVSSHFLQYIWINDLNDSHRHCTACFSSTPSENFVNCSIRLKRVAQNFKLDVQ